MKKKLIYNLNKVPIVIFALMLCLVILSYIQYFNDYYPKELFKTYDEIKENCLSDNFDEIDICRAFGNNKELVNEYLLNENPYENIKSLDAITLTSEILRNTIFFIMQPLSALLIIISVVGRNHKEFKSGMIKNVLMRESYKKYIIDKIKSIAKISLFTPLILIIIFIISCCITKFNFTPNISKIQETFSYFEWKYSNYLLYGFIVCLVQYLLNFSYGIIGMLSFLKNKNSIVSIIISYILVIVLTLFVYLVVGVYILGGIFNLNVAADMNIFGYWYFYENTNYIIVVMTALVIFLSLLSYLCFYTRNKERVVLENEKQVV
ncbi:MAG: hypothetical protein Q4F33_03285 [Mycoplasmatota bacterium]|nr:hypothetical protein [Mycoplasmatota bacterium]